MTAHRGWSRGRQSVKRRYGTTAWPRGFGTAPAFGRPSDHPPCPPAVLCVCVYSFGRRISPWVRRHESIHFVGGLRAAFASSDWEPTATEAAVYTRRATVYRTFHGRSLDECRRGRARGDLEFVQSVDRQIGLNCGQVRARAGRAALQTTLVDGIAPALRGDGQFHACASCACAQPLLRHTSPMNSRPEQTVRVCSSLLYVHSPVQTHTPTEV